MFLKGVVENEKKTVFDNGKVLRDVTILEEFSNKKHAITSFQIWGENGVDTGEGKKVEVEVRLQTEFFRRKDGSQGSKTKLVAMT